MGRILGSALMGVVGLFWFGVFGWAFAWLFGMEAAMALATVAGWIVGFGIVAFFAALMLMPVAIIAVCVYHRLTE